MALNENPTLEEIIDEAERLNNLIVDRGGAKTITPKTTNQVLTKGNYKGDITIKGDANLVASNIVKGKSIFGVAGTATMENHTNLPTWLSKITDTYISAANMPSERAYLTSAVVGTNIYVFDKDLDTMTLCYDTVKNIWTTKANAPVLSSDAIVVAVKTNIYRIGGGRYRDTRNDCYDTTKNTWSTKTAMPTNRMELALSVVGTNMYAIGGRGTNNNNFGTKFNKNECYSTTSNTWSTKAVLPTPRSSAYSESVGTNIYVIGGADNNNYDKNECYSTTSNTWSTKASMPIPSLDGASSVVGDNIYVFGGNNHSVSPYVELNKNQCYNTKTNTWSTKKNMPTKSCQMTASAIGNSVYIIGGYINEGTSVSFKTSRNDCYII